MRRHVLAALSAGVAANDDDAARAALKGIDPVARRFARRRLERSLIDAALACDSAQLANPPAAHVLRVAALTIAKREPNVADEAAVMQAYAELPKPSMPRFPLWTLVSVLVLASMIGSVALYIVTRPGPASRTYARALPPPSADAYEQGGVPLADAALDSLLTEQLTKLVVDGGRARDHHDNELDRVVKSLRAAEPIVKQGAALTRSWDTMLDVFAKSVVIARDENTITGRNYDELREAVRDVSEGFIKAGLGYHLEGRFKNGYPYIQAYRVEEVVFVATGGTRRRVLSLRRLDKLNTAYAVLGMHDEDVGDPVLHLDRIDITVATTVLPVLAAGSPYPLADKEWLAWDLGKGLAAAVGDAVRREQLAALDRDADAASKIAALLVKRGEIIEDWRDQLERKRLYFVNTDQLFVPTTLIDELEGVVPNHQRRRVRDIDTQIAELAGPRIHSRVTELVAATVRRHEAQHGFDYDRDTELRYPPVLESWLGSPRDSNGNEVGIVRSARAELSAYLSQIANDPLTPHAALWNLGRQAFNRDRWGTGECYAALIVLEGLAGKLGATIEGRTFKRGVDRERLATYAKQIAATSSAKLREAAIALWADLYGEPLTTIVDQPHRTITAAR